MLVLAVGWQLSCGSWPGASVLHMGLSMGLLGLPNSIAAGFQERVLQGFPGGAVVKTLPINARDTGSSPGPGRSHMPRSQ